MDKPYQKIGLAVIYLAKKFLSLKKGERLLTITDYTQDSNFARGTIQNALSYLKELNAIQTESRGHLGTYITAINYQLLWESTGIGLLTGAMPLPYSRLYEGLATGIYTAAEDYGIDVNIAYVSGGDTRIRLLLQDRYDFVVTSAITAQKAANQGLQVKRSHSFGPGSYVTKHVLLLADHSKESIEDGMRVALDPSSIDMRILTKEVCKGKNVEFVQMPYNQIVKQITLNNIDAGIWNYDEIREKEIPVAIRDLEDSEIIREFSEAAIIVRAEEEGMLNFLQQAILSETVIQWQRKVVDEIIMPHY